MKLNVATAYSSIVACCQGYLIDLQAVYIFGSQVTEFAHAGSDVDIAILCNQPLSAERRWELSNKLAKLLQCDVDIVDLKSVSTVMQFQVIYTGKRIYCKEPGKQEFFETYVYSDYIRLNEQRHEIIEDIKKRGSIYG